MDLLEDVQKLGRLGEGAKEEVGNGWRRVVKGLRASKSVGKEGRTSAQSSAAKSCRASTHPATESAKYQCALLVELGDAQDGLNLAQHELRLFDVGVLCSLAVESWPVDGRDADDA